MWYRFCLYLCGMKVIIIAIAIIGLCKWISEKIDDREKSGDYPSKNLLKF